MRNKINIIVCIIIVMCVAVFAVACLPTDADGLIKLASPNQLELNGSVLSWGEVKNAQKYFISVDGNENETSYSSTTCDLDTIITEYGNFSISVRAYGDGKKYGTSDKSQPITYHRGQALDTPNLVITDKIASWDAVENAVSYSIRVTDSKNAVLDEVTTQELKYDFTKKKASDDASGDAEEKEIYGEYGAYRISVTANPSEEDIQRSPSAPAVKTYYNATVLEVPEWMSMSTTTIRWSAVANATNYTLRKTYQDGSYEDAEVTTTSYAYRTKFNLEKVGEYSFSIRANGDNQVYYSSEFSEKNDDYVVTKLAEVQPQDIQLNYVEGLAKLSWKLPADSLATEFTLNLSALLPDGSVELESSILQQTISNKIVFVVAKVYDFYKYNDDASDIEKVDGQTILLYNIDGFAKVRYNGTDYSLKDKENKDLLWKDYAHGTVDVICDMSDGIKFVYDSREYTNELGAILNQDTEEEEDVLGPDNHPLFYFADVDGETSLQVEKGVIYGDGDEITYHTFTLTIDDVFILKDDSDDETTYSYLISDDKYYGILYDVSISANNDSTKFIASQSTTTDGQYLSYKIPQIIEGKYVVNNAGEYAYIIVNSFNNPGNTDEFKLANNINFNGYEMLQIETFNGVIDGDMHTVSGIVVGNKVMTQNGAMLKDDTSILEYAMFVNLDSQGDTTKGMIKNIFYLGIGYVGYDKDTLDESVTSIQVAPIAINNKGTIRNVVVQSDSIKAEGAEVAGMVINNYGLINTASVYANLEGTQVGGVMLNNDENAIVAYVGFYGDVTSTLSDILAEGVTNIAAAGFVVNNMGGITNSFAIGNVSVTASGLDEVYAGGFAAINSGEIVLSYSGEFTLNNVGTTVIASGDNGYAGGFVGHNSGRINSSYSTNRATASLYVGGFVGYNDGEITSSYATGSTARTGENRGVFVGKNDEVGNIENCAGYSTDTWASDSVVEVLTSSEQLDDIVEILYGEGSADMVVMRDKGYRNPVIIGLIYTKENTISMRPSATVEDQGVVYNNQALDTEAVLHGDNTKKNNRVVIELTIDGVISRYIYGYVV